MKQKLKKEFKTAYSIPEPQKKTENLGEQYTEKSADVSELTSQNNAPEDALCDEDKADDIQTHTVTVTSCPVEFVFYDTVTSTKAALSVNDKSDEAASISSSAAIGTTFSQTTVSFITTAETITSSVGTTAIQTTTAPVLTDPAPITTSQTFQSNNCEPVYTTTSDISYEPPCDVGMDYTVYPDICFDITDNIIDISEYMQFEYSPPHQDGTDLLLAPWQSEALRSDEVVYGIVENQYLTVIDSLPYVQLDIMVEYPLKSGELSYNDRISVYVPGEYMPLDVFINEYNCRDTFSHLSETEISGSTAYFPWSYTMEYYSGMELLFFIRKDEGTLPENTYKLSSDSIYSLYYSDGDEFILTDDESVRFTVNEFHKFMGY